MAKGGVRNRNGAFPDPLSARSDARGVKMSLLPSEGYVGEVPRFPLPVPAAEDGGHREQDIWLEAWRSPQAAAWIMEPWRWPVVAEYCRLKANVEAAPVAAATLISQLHRYRDQLGLTPAGLKENGWSIAADEVAVRRVQAAAVAKKAEVVRKRRMRAVPDDFGGSGE